MSQSAKRFKADDDILGIWNSVTKSRGTAGGADIIGVDISGRHRESGAYLMVGAAVAATIGTNRIHEITGIGLGTSRGEPTLTNAVELVGSAVGDLPEAPDGPIVAERGEFYGEPARTVGISFPTEFKYVESIAERQTVQAAHHAAYATRKLLL